MEKAETRACLATLLLRDAGLCRAPHGLQVGDILAKTLRCDRDDVSFHRVVAIPGPREVEVEHLRERVVSGTWWHGRVMPDLEGPACTRFGIKVRKVSMAEGKTTRPPRDPWTTWRLWSGEAMAVYIPREGLPGRAPRRRLTARRPRRTTRRRSGWL